MLFAQLCLAYFVLNLRTSWPSCVAFLFPVRWVNSPSYGPSSFPLWAGSTGDPPSNGFSCKYTYEVAVSSWYLYFEHFKMILICFSWCLWYIFNKAQTSQCLQTLNNTYALGLSFLHTEAECWMLKILSPHPSLWFPTQRPSPDCIRYCKLFYCNLHILFDFLTPVKIFILCVFLFLDLFYF